MTDPGSVYRRLERQHQATAQRVLLWVLMPLCLAFFVWDLASGDPGRKTIPALVLFAVGMPLAALLHWRERRRKQRVQQDRCGE